MVSLDIIRDKFIAIEQKYDVYNQTAQGIYFWKLIRIDLFNDITVSLDIVNNSHPSKLSDMAKKALRLIKYSLIATVNRRKIDKSDILLLTHGRKVLSNGKYIDIYMDNFISQKKREDKKLLIIDRPDHYGKHYPSPYENIVYYERLGHFLREIYLPFMRIEKDTLLVLHNIEKDIKQQFGLDINLVKIVKKKIYRFYAEKKYFGKMLDFVKPEMVYLMVSYGKEDLIAAAKERNITTVEFQHGIISTYHMGYFFPSTSQIPYFPDKLILFGEFWKDSVHYPVNCQLEVQPFQWIQKDVILTTGNKNEEVLFISQGTIGERLSEIAADFSQKSKMRCYFKLHPSEFSVWKNSYKKLLKASEGGNIIVISNELTIYQLFQQCKYAVGVYSTSIYEALMYGCITFSVQLEGYQYMEYLITKNYIQLLQEKFDDETLKQSKCVTIPDSTYFYTS